MVLRVSLKSMFVNFLVLVCLLSRVVTDNINAAIAKI